MQSGQRAVRRIAKLAEVFHRRLVLSLENQPMSGFSMPDIRMFQQNDKLFDGGVRELWGRAALKVWGSNSIDPPSITSVFKIEHRFQIIGHRPGMLDRLAVHVQQMQCTIRGGYEVDGAKPVVSG